MVTPDAYAVLYRPMRDDRALRERLETLAILKPR
jgi:hypothetical protein